MKSTRGKGAEGDSVSPSIKSMREGSRTKTYRHEVYEGRESREELTDTRHEVHEGQGSRV